MWRSSGSTPSSSHVARASVSRSVQVSRLACERLELLPEKLEQETTGFSSVAPLWHLKFLHWSPIQVLPRPNMLSFWDLMGSDFGKPVFGPVLLTFMLPGDVKCQDDAADDAAAATNAPTAGAGDASAQTVADSTGADSTQTATPGDAVAPVTDSSVAPAVDAAVVEDTPAPVMPDVKCVGKEDITESKAVKASVATSDCAATKNILENVPAKWCSKQACKINIFQDDSTMLLDSEDASLGTLASALQSEEMKNKLGVTDVKYSSSGSSVLVGILVTGLLAAVALTVGYFKCQRRPSPKGERLAEEGTPVDQQNQANTLASDAPLNPPPETPEKPSANGEAPEGDKAQTPPTNGHSTPANTADTEL
ncbi:hypothetical protein WMY93_028080 [Mugilogobius chulae]|uniref:Hematopoietic progenitor cell antigen CD34 n=1 Tax=Mugilogobius chulae TaxID=88201 RepID=A0AAW0N0I4_9GOBI